MKYIWTIVFTLIHIAVYSQKSSYYCFGGAGVGFGNYQIDHSNNTTQPIQTTSRLPINLRTGFGSNYQLTEKTSATLELFFEKRFTAIKATGTIDESATNTIKTFIPNYDTNQIKYSKKFSIVANSIKIPMMVNYIKVNENKKRFLVGLGFYFAIGIGGRTKTYSDGVIGLPTVSMFPAIVQPFAMQRLAELNSQYPRNDSERNLLYGNSEENDLHLIDYGGATQVVYYFNNRFAVYLSGNFAFRDLASKSTILFLPKSLNLGLQIQLR
jgi:dUTPase